ncbi:MAG: RDD family protein [Rhizobacter sp.]|nr:RDD family protein [Rhizobacter sp.]
MSTNPYAPPTAAVADVNTGVEYAGFWIRLGAALIDAVLIIAISYPVLYAIYGAEYFAEDKASFISGPADVLISWVFPAVASILFWRSKQATPGKMALSLKIVDARTGKTLSLGQSVARYLGYFVSTLPLGLGFIWIAFDARKQGWHDKIGKAVVIRSKAATTQPVTFEDA